MKQSVLSKSVLGIAILLSSAGLAPQRAFADPVAAEPALDAGNMEFHPILEVQIPQKSDADNRFVVITNKDGEMTGIGFDGSWGSPWEPGLRASLQEIRNGKSMQFGWSDKPFLNIQGSWFNTQGGVLKIASATDAALSRYFRVYKDHGVWRVQQVHWQNNNWVDDGMVNNIEIKAGYSIFSGMKIKEINMSEQGAAIEKWKQLKAAGHYPTFQINPSVEPAPASVPSTTTTH